MSAPILLVEDKDSLRAMLKLALESQGHEVIEARDQPEAVAALRDSQPALVLSDLRLPKGDGMGVLRAVKEVSPDTEVVLMTAGRILASGNIHEIRRLMDAHPHHIAIATPEPRKLATRILEEPGLHSIAFSEEVLQVRLETREPERFYRLLNRLVLEENATIDEITSPDDNLEAVFQYLVGP